MPKVAVPQQLAEYRPISITSFFSRVMERMVISTFLYPALLSPPSGLTFKDQFAFQPTGSTTAAITSLLDHVTHMLVNNPYVILIVLDFSKAFDTIRQVTLSEKLTQLEIPEHVYN